MNQDDLTGTIVLVQPKLTHDPAGKKNEVGIITSADMEQDNIMVGFSDGTEALFSADALLVLRDIGGIRRDAENDFTLLFREDYNDIKEVCWLAELSAPSGQRAAVELAQKNPMAQEYAMHPLTDEPGLEQYKSRTR